MKLRPVGAELFRADRRTDMTTVFVAFRYSENATKIVFMSRELGHTQNWVTHKNSFRASRWNRLYLNKKYGLIKTI